MAKILNSIHPDDELHYKKMGLKKDEVEIWEDGLRTSGIAMIEQIKDEKL